MAKLKNRLTKPRLAKVPNEVNIAIYIYWILYVISVLVLFKDGKEQPVIVITSSLIVLAFTYWVTKKLREGRRWMRTLILVSTILNIIVSAKETVRLDTNAVFSFIGSLIILFLLYAKKNNQFFKPSKHKYSFDAFCDWYRRNTNKAILLSSTMILLILGVGYLFKN
jgi:cation transport ATPase